MPSEIVVERRWRDRVASLAGSRRETWVIAGVVGALLVGAVLFFSRSAPAVVAPPAQAADLPQGEPAADGTAPATSMAVHVAGAVRRPGLYELAGNLRVADAIEAAGGPTRRADLDALNLAQPIADGVKIYVSRRGEAPATSADGGPLTSDAPVGINSADAAALEQVPGIGPVKAAAIVDYRAQIGSFESIDQLLEVTGIGPATLESLRPYVTL
jgi:competence protein ComEA